MAIDPNLGVKLIFVLGITNIIGLLLVYLSCRCRLNSKLFARLIKHKLYERFYKLHCYFWWLFVISVLLHATLAFLIFGIPFK